MAQNTTTQVDPQSAIWQCLEIESEYGSQKVWRENFEKVSGPTHPDPDLIGVEDLAGIEVFKNRRNSNSPTLELTALTGEKVVPWLRGTAPHAVIAERPTMRVLLGNQVIQNDQLHPPAARLSTNISKTLLAECFRVPTVAVEQLGQEVAHSAQYPLLTHTRPSLTCYSVVSGPCSVLWSYDASSGTTTALIVMRGSRVRSMIRSRICKTLGTLSEFCDLPGIIPFVILDSMLDFSRPIIYFDELNSEYNQVHIGRGLTELRPMEAFGQAYNRVNTSYAVLKHADTVLSMSRWESLSTLQRPQGISDHAWDQLQQHHRSLRQAIQFREEELTCLTAHVRHLKDRSAALLSTTMGLMSFNDSKVMLEIAEATKKDSTSMKVLALVTIVFLPSTALAAIMAIPDMFDFGGDARALVNSRFWIFFAVALPLTLLTMTCTWCWLRWESLGRRMWPKRRQEGIYAENEKMV